MELMLIDQHTEPANVLEGVAGEDRLIAHLRMDSSERSKGTGVGH
jgi:hypothetical protein